ncbi:glucose-6-phosphate isomerase [termite gut metagenome]|uniref:glucose-6-phosphate isomerase n=1 Tax=termite gut metagenome TaxID=433724 RepID=A0A5J4QLK9_9ZZZZ
MRIIIQLNDLHLLYGVVTYAAGTIGNEPVRSQGHIHVRSGFVNGYSTPEVYEIWQGEAIIYMQEFGGDNP